MEIFGIGGIGIHVLVALFFAIHAIRNGQPIFWLFVLFSFPLLGSLVYLFAVYLPASNLRHGAGKAVSVAVKTLDPGRELREARAAFDYTPTAQNQMRLASALLENGAAEEAAGVYETCLQGVFSSDLEIRYSAARAWLESGKGAHALPHVEFIRRNDVHFRAEKVSILMARALAGAGRQTEAKAEFDDGLQRFGSFECRAEYAIWAAGNGEHALAAQLRAELDQAMQRWSRHTREMYQPLLRRLKTAA
ncbi:hypothetical protein [Janthinobacterium agaricidamnosum]|uniref:Putative transmembrane protein n=1 Tax=Janthinobacterium agaricidamnosum NBRC 102515 = DSM 9628 TaxID=1349767 RepID=W0UYN4_9BURK|nr:hypothetical protein [Janthinobacterium agaricidamnosum]CDG81679.1 putative transmembrane protein [Janthinobacterium agaricidamnosum NBRC 102515 = DSM 9628]